MSKFKDIIENKRVERDKEYGYDHSFGSHKSDLCDEEVCVCGKFSKERSGVKVIDNETNESKLESIRFTRDWYETN